MIFDFFHDFLALENIRFMKDSVHLILMILSILFTCYGLSDFGFMKLRRKGEISHAIVLDIITI